MRRIGIAVNDVAGNQIICGPSRKSQNWRIKCAILATEINAQRGSKQMRKLTLLAIAAVFMLAQSSPALSSTFSGPYACRASAIPTVYSDTAPVMTLSANAGGSFSGGTLLFFKSDNLCQYSLLSGNSSFTTISGLAGYGNVAWVGSASNNGACVSSLGFFVAFVLSGTASSNASANTIQISDSFGPSWECTQK